jgi:glycosyltransferase involved in cell wall biosynthesis
MNINYSFAPNFKTGYSIASINIGLELSNLGCDLTLFPIGGVSQEQHVQKWVSENYYKRKLCDYKAKGLKLWHQGDLLDFPICSERIGFPIFELNKFTSQELNSLNSLDRIVVCSKWAKQICIDNQVLTQEKISVCPLGVDRGIFRERIKPPTDKYIFINMGKMSMNKGGDILPVIFNKAFSQNDNVELWIIGDNPFLDKEEKLKFIKLYLDSPLGNKIRFLPPQNTQFDIASIIAKADVGIFPIRCEGWNLCLLEIMSMGLPCITTMYSGQSEFCNKNNSFLVEVDELEPAIDNKWFFGQGDWAKLGSSQIDQFVSHMRYCYENRLNNNPEGIHTSALFSWQNSANILQEILGLK